jgi:hypothetical protein
MSAMTGFLRKKQTLKRVSNENIWELDNGK